MFQKKKNTPLQKSVRTRQSSPTLTSAFKRNNVVISSRQKEVAKRQQSVTQRQHEKKQQAERRRTKLRLLTLVCVAIVVSFVYRSAINGVVIDSNASSKLTEIQRTEYENHIFTKYRTHTLLGQSWLLDARALEKDMIDSYPEIERARFSSSTPVNTSLRVEIRFRRPVFTWKDISGRDQFVDSSGVLFSKNLDPGTSSGTLTQIEDQSGVVLEEGSSVITRELIAFVGLLHSKVPTLYESERIDRVIIPPSTREVHVRVSSQPYHIKFNSTRQLDEQVSELASLLGHLKAGGVVPREYIDLRVAHKAFYK